ncbi:ROK family protein [Actinomycetospora soli]|uniref:ROK family protein n=1 Tax=Actinomycetospora soli TaxID=2893887 RepID=UPI001E64888C|nr:ROK family protein [Actinomycetospora soli]MCD2187826.1 ROK family protein [Actinomycetospora soli]
MPPSRALPPQLVRAHEGFEALYAALEDGRVGRERVADVVKRLLVLREEERLPSASEVAAGYQLRRPKRISQDVASRAVKALADPYRLVVPQAARREGSGRPSIPLLLGGDRWFVVGVTVWRLPAGGASIMLAVTDLLGRRLCQDTPTGVVEEKGSIADGVVERVVKAMSDRRELRGRRLFGVGVSVSGHVVDGTEVRLSPVPEASRHDLGQEIADGLDQVADRTLARFARGAAVPVVVDNDAALLAVRETFQPDQPFRDTVVAAVFPDGIGSSVVVNNRVYRGARGAAGEVGHLVVGSDLVARARATEGPDTRAEAGFAAECSCTDRDDERGIKRGGHVDCYAPPARIAAQVGRAETIRQLINTSDDDRQVSDVFAIAGEALGIALSSLITIHDPEQLVVYLPKAFEDVILRDRSNLAGHRYWATAGDVIRERSYPAADALPISLRYVSDEDLKVLGAESAGLRVVDSFIKHGKGRCKCYISPPVERVEEVRAQEWDADSLWP